MCKDSFPINHPIIAYITLVSTLLRLSQSHPSSYSQVSEELRSLNWVSQTNH